MAEFTMADALAVERWHPEKITLAKQYALWNDKTLSPMKRRIGIRMADLSGDIERQRKAIQSRAKSAHDEMLRLIVSCQRGETRIHYTGWADSLTLEIEKLYQLDAQFETLKDLFEQDDHMVVDSEGAKPFVERLTKERGKLEVVAAESNRGQVGGRNAKERDTYRIQAVKAAAKIEVIDQILGGKEA